MNYVKTYGAHFVRKILSLFFFLFFFHGLLSDSGAVYQGIVLKFIKLEGFAVKKRRRKKKDYCGLIDESYIHIII